MSVYTHINLSGLKGFLSLLDDEQSNALVDKICLELAQKENQFQQAIDNEDTGQLLRLCQQLDPIARSFQLDLVVNSIPTLTNALESVSASGSVIHKSEVDEFMDLLRAVNRSLRKLKSKGLKSDRIKTRKR